MIQLFLNNKRVQIKSDTSIKLTRENPYFYSGSTYTYDVELPLDIPMNKSFFGNINRIDVGKEMAEYEARLIVDNRTLLVGTAVVTTVTDLAVKVQLLGEGAAYNFRNSMNKTYIDELDLGNFAADAWPDEYGAEAFVPGRRGELYQKYKENPPSGSAFGYGGTHWRKAGDELFDGRLGWVMYPIFNSTADVVCNDFVYQATDNNNSQFKLVFEENRSDSSSRVRNEESPCRFVAPQPMVWLIAKKVAEATGRVLEDEDNALYTDSFLNRIFIASAAGYAQYKMSLPHWTVNEFWNNIEQAFGVIVKMPENSKNIRIIKRGEFYKKQAEKISIEKIVDEFQVEFDDDSNAEISSNNVGFENFDSDPEDLLSESVINSARFVDDYDNIEAIRNHYNNLSSSERVDWLLESQDALFRCRDGRQYVYFSETYETRQFREVNEFRPRFTKENDEVEIQLKFVPCKFEEHELRVLRSSERHDGAEKWVLTKVPVMILSRPDRADTANLYEYTGESQILEFLIHGEEDVTEEESKGDLIYIGVIPEEVKKGAVSFSINGKIFENLQYPIPIIRSKYIWDIDMDQIETDENISLSLCKVDGEHNLYSATIENSPLVNARIRECIKFVSTELPDTEVIYLMRNKTFLCEKLEAELNNGGMNKVITGYFYRIEL